MSTTHQKSKRVVITGIGGFVGKHLATHLINHQFDVYGFDRNGSTIPHATTQILNILHAIEVDAYIQKIKPDYLIHLAAQSSVKKSWDTPQQTIDINVNGTKNILTAIKNHAPTCISLVISSAEIYGIPKELPITEKTPINPNSPYGESRKLQEELCHQFTQDYHLNIIIARSFPHTGPGQSDQFVASSFAKQIAKIEQNQQPPILSVGNLDAKRDFTDVRDVVNAYYLLLTTPNINNTAEIFNVCSGSSVEINSILQTLLKMSTKHITITQDAAKIRPNDIPDMVGSNQLLHNATLWQPIIPITVTLKEMLNYWRSEIKK